MTFIDKTGPKLIKIPGNKSNAVANMVPPVVVAENVKSEPVVVKDSFGEDIKEITCGEEYTHNNLELVVDGVSYGLIPTGTTRILINKDTEGNCGRYYVNFDSEAPEATESLTDIYGELPFEADVFDNTEIDIDDYDTLDVYGSTSRCVDIIKVKKECPNFVGYDGADNVLFNIPYPTLTLETPSETIEGIEVCSNLVMDCETTVEYNENNHARGITTITFTNVSGNITTVVCESDFIPP